MKFQTLFGLSSVGFLAVTSAVGCGSSSAGPTHPLPDGGGADAAHNPDSGVVGMEGGNPLDGGDSLDGASDGPSVSLDAATDASEASMGTGYPAFPPTVGTVVDNKGPVLSTPRIVTITWQSDSRAPTYQAFDDGIGATPYWQLLSEYGVGAATSTAADHVVITGSPEASWTTTDQVDSWAATMIAGAPGNGWPAPDQQTVYILYLPQTTPDLTSMGVSACEQFGGYHTELQGASSYPGGAVFALIMSYCEPLEVAEQAASHELLESSTDPYPAYEPAWVNFDLSSLAWELYNDWLDELGDACAYSPESFYVDTGSFPYGVQRFWSNASAKAGHNPCVPVPSGPYNNVTPFGLETLASANALSATGTVAAFPNATGWHISPGQTANVSVGMYSDGAITWSVEAVEQDAVGNMTNYLTVTPSQFTGKNGDTIPISIKVNSAPTQGNVVLLTFQSLAQDGTMRVDHWMPVVIGAY